MDRQSLVNLLRADGPWRRPWWSAARALLRVASWVYGVVMRLRRWGYRVGILPSKRVAVPVISVGNITTGGTGKTPMVAMLARKLQAAGRSVGIVLRGYKSRGGKSDEAELLKQLTGATVVANPDRACGAADAISAGADAIILDDGFQHRRLRRDLDVVLIDATDPFGLRHVLPRGFLREPLAALRDAQVIVITRSDAIAQAELKQLKTKLSSLSPRAAICIARHRPAAILDEAGNRLSPESLVDRRVFALCGIGNPSAFLGSLQRLGANVIGRCEMEDHCDYPAPLLEKIGQTALRHGAQCVVTTQKDFVKIGPGRLPLPLHQLAVEMEIVEGKEKLDPLITLTLTEDQE